MPPIYADPVPPYSLDMCPVPSLGVWMQAPGRDVLDSITQSRLDWVVFDLQHGIWSISELEQACSQCGVRSNAGIIPLVRTPLAPSAAEIGAVLDAGAWGLIIPVVEQSATLATIRAHALFPPAGRRSVARCSGLKNTGLGLDDYIVWTRQNLKIIAMIETPAGIEHYPAIAEQADGVLFGLRDLQASYQCSREASLARVAELLDRSDCPHPRWIGLAGGVPDSNLAARCSLQSIGSVRDLLTGTIRRAGR